MPTFVRALIGFLLLLTACAPAWQTAPDQPTAPPPPARPSSTLPASPSTSTPAFTPTITPVPSSTPTPTATPLPTLPPDLADLRIAYLSQGKLWLWRGGRARPLTAVSASTYLVALSPDGAWVAYSSGKDLWAVSSDGGAPIQFLSPDDLARMKIDRQAVGIGAMAWTPAGDRLVFNTLIQKYGIRPAGDLYQADPQTGRVMRLLAPGQGGPFTLSPDGAWAASVTPQRIWLARLDNGAVYQALTYEAVWTPTEEKYYPQPVWAPDSRSLWVAVPPYNVFYGGDKPARVWQVDVETRKAQLAAEIDARLGQELFLSPDLTTLLAWRRPTGAPGNGHYGEITLAALDGSNSFGYAQDVFAFRGWSPRGLRFFLESSAGLWVAQPNAPPVRLTSAFERAAWLTDDAFLYRSVAPAGSQIGVGLLDDRYLPLIGPLDLTAFDFSTGLPR